MHEECDYVGVCVTVVVCMGACGCAHESYYVNVGMDLTCILP